MAQEDNKKSVQTLLNNSHNETFNMQEVIAYEGKGNGTIGAISQEKPDTTYTWTLGNLTQKVETYTDRTVTTDYTWVDGVLTVKDITVS